MTFDPIEPFGDDVLAPETPEAAHAERGPVPGNGGLTMRLGYQMGFVCAQPTPMILNLHIHSSRAADLVSPDRMQTEPYVATSTYLDGFGNRCTRLVAPAGRFRVTADAVIRDDGLEEAVVPDAVEHPVEALPDEALVYLLGSRYCDTDNLSVTAWQLFGHSTPGWARVQAVCDFVHQHLTFGYGLSRPSKTASEAFYERCGVCRDFAHLAIAFCRSLNIPARYCTGYLGDIRIPPVDAPMDFAGWFEAYLGGQWHTFDPRNNTRRIGRVLVARGRDAADVALSMTFGPNVLETFEVTAYEIE